MEQVGAERALARMRRYTTVSIAGVVAVLTVFTAVGYGSPPLAIAALIAGGLATWVTLWWETPPPLGLTLAAVVVNAAFWSYLVIAREAPLGGLALPLAAMVPISQLTARRSEATVATGVLMLVPVVVAWIAMPGGQWVTYAIAALGFTAVAAFLLFLNRYAWGLYLEIDAARRLAGDLAIVQERYRFATDLHDIQGHTLHVLRLKTQLAARLVDTDPEAAKSHLAEADGLITDTLANTRALAFGDRTVTLAGELANARHLFEAAGISFSVSGEPAPGPHEELFGLVVREATTNILRHAQSTTVSVALEPGRIVVSNDGSPAAGRALSGLARLGERFTIVGGTLRTSSVDGVFRTEASA